jgi:hypothetical protein
MEFFSSLLPDFFWMDMLTRSISSPNNHYSQICNFSIIKITALLSSLSCWTGDFLMWNVHRDATIGRMRKKWKILKRLENNRKNIGLESQ